MHQARPPARVPYVPPASPWSPSLAVLGGIVDRMNDTADGLTNAAVADRTGFNQETVRRYLISGPPGAEFLRAFCKAFNVSADWLLLGRGKGPAKRR